MPYVIYELAETQTDTLGQSWANDEIVENIALCHYQPIGECFQKYLSKDRRVLEAGCGMGRWVFYLRSKGYDATGIDTSRQAVALAKQYDPSVDIQLADVTQTGFADGSFGAVISLGVMEHFPEGPQKVLAETRRILADDGWLFVTIPPANLVRMLCTHPLTSLRRIRQALRGRSFTFGEYRYTVRQFAKHLRASGFEIKEIATDELTLPRNMGLYVDFPRLRHKELKWTLSGFGLLVARALNLISDSIYRGGVLFVCRKNGTIIEGELAN